MTTLRFGAKVDNYGAAVTHHGLSEPAARAEAAGFTSLWLSDHVVMVPQTQSRFPFTDDGKIYWDPRDPWYEPVACLPVLAQATTRAEVGVGVLLAALRHPLVLAKQLASIDALSSGRLVLGVGAGWMAEEFDIMNVPFGTRGQRLDEWITLLRRCWTGEPGPFDGTHYQVPAGTYCYPQPAHRVPIIVGGMSPHALHRAATADGWLALPRPSDDIAAIVQAAIAQIRADAADAGHDLTGWRCIVNAHAPSQIAPLLPRLEKLGVTDVIVDLDYDAPDGPTKAFELLRDAAG